MSRQPEIVLVVGSAPNAIVAKAWGKTKFSHIVTMNNAWKIRDDWDFLVHPEDFPVENRPDETLSSQRIITAQDYVPIQNDFGGFVYAGGTMAFTTAYWVLGHLKPKVIAFIGCDMVYPTDGSSTHFYGTGKADPLRKDVTLQSLEAKSARLFYTALTQDCYCFNLSSLAESRLVFPRSSIDALSAYDVHQFAKLLSKGKQRFDPELVDRAIQKEQALGYQFASGRYWDHLDEISAQECHALDQLWLQSFKGELQADSNLTNLEAALS